MTQVLRQGVILLALALPVGNGLAAATDEEIAALGGERYTCLGAERAGSASGVAEYTGKWFKNWPGQNKAHGYEPGPYAEEQALFHIRADNYQQYAAHLSEGQKAMFEAYPDAFYMKVYPSHRDFRLPEWTCTVVEQNAREARIVDQGLGVEGVSGAHPFPFPKNGLQAIWNVIKPNRAWTEKAVYDIADVYPNGTIAWGKWDYQVMAPGNHPRERGRLSDPYDGFFLIKILAPARQKGEVSVGYQPNNYVDNATQAWQYNPGIRRVRKAPEIGHDYPVPPSGLRTSDDDYIFNGSPERYTWKLVGKKEIFIPYHNFKINDPAIAYDDLITPKTINPEYLRYELHRVWVIEADLKDGWRHIYKKRRIYADEDSWLAYMSENYDNQDFLWRANWIAYFYSQESGTFHRGVSLYHDLTSKAYEATYLVNQAGDDWWRLNTPMRAQQFKPEAAARAGR